MLVLKCIERWRIYNNTRNLVLCFDKKYFKCTISYYLLKVMVNKIGVICMVAYIGSIQNLYCYGIVSKRFVVNVMWGRNSRKLLLTLSGIACWAHNYACTVVALDTQLLWGVIKITFAALMQIWLGYNCEI